MAELFHVCLYSRSALPFPGRSQGVSGTIGKAYVEFIIA